LWLLGVAVVEIAVCVSAFLPGSPPWHIIGYCLGAVVVPLTVAGFRQLDRGRQRSGLYASPGGVQMVPAPLLVIGVLLAVVHAYYLAINKRLA
jgi:hypothetical protein